jgi:hypothetical protein
MYSIPKERMNADFLSVQLIGMSNVAAGFRLKRPVANHTNWNINPLAEAACDDKAFVALAFQYLTTREGQRGDELPPCRGKPSQGENLGHKHLVEN